MGVLITPRAIALERIPRCAYSMAKARLAAAGYPLDHWGGQTASRRSVYVVDPDSVQFEFVEYLSEDVALRNAYEAA